MVLKTNCDNDDDIPLKKKLIPTLGKNLFSFV